MSEFPNGSEREFQYQFCTQKRLYQYSPQDILSQEASKYAFPVSDGCFLPVRENSYEESHIHQQDPRYMKQ